jgi:hypothetical protein
MNTDAEAKIRMLKSSLRCSVYGLLGLLPVIGLPFAIATLWISGRVRAREKLFWNAARPYRIWGVVIATVGTLFWLLIVVLIVYSSVSNGGWGGTYSLSGGE